jgi:Putative prokaryotic signal transducing protein
MGRRKTGKPAAVKGGGNLVTVARFGNAIEAHLARTKLQSRGIKAVLLDEHLISLMPVYDLGLGGVRLQVREADGKRAARVLGLEAKGSLWAPRPLVLATHLFSGYVFAALAVLLGFLFFIGKKFVFWFLVEWRPL